MNVVGNEYLTMTLDRERTRQRKTKVWIVNATKGGKLGEIRWFGRWRQYTFFPEPDTTFNPDCLMSIAGYCAMETQSHRREHRRTA